MQVNQDPKFQTQFPELYSWELIDTISLCTLACELRDACKRELKQPIEQRGNVPGLRYALNRIAERANV